MPAFYDILDVINAGLIGANIGAGLMFICNLIDLYITRK